MAHIDRIVETQSTSVINAFDKRIETLEKERFALQEKIATLGKPVRDVKETFRTAFEFLASSWKIWNSNRLEDNRACRRGVHHTHLSGTACGFKKRRVITVPRHSMAGRPLLLTLSD
ncbi:MAG: hypothetical protein KDI63_13145 [Gammaproteobacteria bacterium]|nr:hypothetical protein [Gammaproteobacteria bacterium]